MRIAQGVFALVLAAGFGWAADAQAQRPAQGAGTPQGSYLRSCGNVDTRGDTLIATCRRQDGREERSALNGFNRCVGDIGNFNGVLHCNGAGGQQLRGQSMGGEGPRGGPGRAGPPFDGQRGSGPYDRQGGSGPYDGPRGPGGYDGPRGPGGYGGPGYGQDSSGRCGQLYREMEELRARLDREFNPVERARLERRLHDLREQRERCR